MKSTDEIRLAFSQAEKALATEGFDLSSYGITIDGFLDARETLLLKGLPCPVDDVNYDILLDLRQQIGIRERYKRMQITIDHNRLEQIGSGLPACVVIRFDQSTNSFLLVKVLLSDVEDTLKRHFFSEVIMDSDIINANVAEELGMSTIFALASSDPALESKLMFNSSPPPSE